MEDHGLTFGKLMSFSGKAIKKRLALFIVRMRLRHNELCLNAMQDMLDDVMAGQAHLEKRCALLRSDEQQLLNH